MKLILSFLIIIISVILANNGLLFFDKQAIMKAPRFVRTNIMVPSLFAHIRAASVQIKAGAFPKSISTIYYKTEQYNCNFVLPASSEG